MTNEPAVHVDPVWRDLADFIVSAEIPDTQRTEQLWVHRLADTTFSVCCIPFFVYDIALGDTVVTDSSFVVREVNARSGRQVARVWFGGREAFRIETARRVVDMGALIEWSSENLLAVDCADGETAALVIEHLTKEHNEGRLVFELAAPRKRGST